MKILLIAMKYDYGNPLRGYSYDYYNSYLPMIDLGHEVILFDYMTELQELGRDGMNNKLLKLVEQMRPSLAWVSLFTDQFKPEVIEKLREFTKTLCFFFDDTWRVDYSRFWAHHFDFFTTPDIYGEKKYAAFGLPNAIHFPFGCDEKTYHKAASSKKYDISFVGGWHPYRAWLVNRLRSQGFLVKTAGYGWDGGGVSHEDMVTIFNESRINLNLSNSASWDVRYLTSSLHAIKDRIRTSKTVEQLKARHFEINSCGAFQLSYYVEGLEQYYEIGQEIGIYLDPDDLMEKVKIYLEDENLRESIAQAGYARTLNSHTFAMRFHKLLGRMGFADV